MKVNEQQFNKKQKELLDFIEQIELGEWFSGDRIPNSRFPIIAIISTKDCCNGCETIPITGQFDKDLDAFMPFVMCEEDLISFFRWDRVLRWRYLMYNEADRKWLALINERGNEIDNELIEMEIYPDK